VGDEMKRKLCTGPWEYEKRSEGKKGNRGMQKRGKREKAGSSGSDLIPQSHRMSHHHTIISSSRNRKVGYDKGA
jgi:hypothetical protein